MALQQKGGTSLVALVDVPLAPVSVIRYGKLSDHWLDQAGERVLEMVEIFQTRLW